MNIYILSVILLFMSVVSIGANYSPINISGTLIDMPDCRVESGNDIEVNFGDEIITTRIDGENYKANIHWPLVCSNMLSTKLTLKIEGERAEFDTSLLKTSTDNLAIILYVNDTKLMLGGNIPFDYENPPVLWAAPVSNNNSDLKHGPFTGFATMIIGYQ